MKNPLRCFLKANNPSPTTEAPFPRRFNLYTNARISAEQALSKFIVLGLTSTFILVQAPLYICVTK